MVNISVSALFDIDKTIAKKHFNEIKYPFEILDKIGEIILDIGASLSCEEYNKIGENIWVAKDAKIEKSALILGPCIIDKGAEIRHCAYIRGNAVIGKGAVVGNSCEIKNSVIFDGAQVPHFNYVGDSILGYKAHMGASSITSNVKGDKSLVVIKSGEEKIYTNRKKVGAFLGDFAEIGCGAVLAPGTVVGKGSTVYPLVFVRGVIKNNCIVKAMENIVQKH